MKPHDFTTELRLAESAALLAGHHLRDRRIAWTSIEKTEGHDVKIKADRMAEALILQQLQSASHHAILSEEAGSFASTENRAIQDQGNDPQLRWVIDPLDGSLNYHRDIPLCCVSIALYRGLDPILGVVHDFNHDKLYSGLVGTGAWINQCPMAPSDISAVSQAVLGTGFPVQTDFSTAGLGTFIKKVQSFRKVRWFGSAALSLCFVASGKTDAYQENNIMLWDVGAGCALVKASGGAVYMTPSEGDRSGHRLNVLAHNGKLGSALSL